MGVWIETFIHKSQSVDNTVTPCVGVWIETVPYTTMAQFNKSHPAWVCGLKLGGIIAAGASLGHTLRGCVD